MTEHHDACLMRAVTMIGAALAITAATRADIGVANYVNTDQFHYHVHHMPDLDQRRIGLEGDGQCHCVPTSTMNLLAYAANHGFPLLPPGVNYWQAQENFDLATFMIWAMGSPGLMNTQVDLDADPIICLTSGSDWTKGMNDWLQGHPTIVANQHLSDNNFTVDLANVAKALVAYGGRIGAVAYGRYDVIGRALGVDVVRRRSGHAVTVVRAQRSANGSILWVRDPADELPVVLTQQSPFATLVYEVTTVPVFIANSEGEIVDFRLMDALDYDPNAIRHRLLDGFRMIAPAVGYSWQSSVTQFQVNQFGGFAGHGHDPVTEHALPPLILGVAEMELHPQIGDFFVLSTGGEVSPIQLLRYDPLTGESATVSPPPAALIGTARGGGLTTSRCGAIFVSCTSATPGTAAPMMCFWPAPDAEPGVIPAAHPIDAIAYDDTRGHVIALSADSRTISDYTYMDDDIPSGAPIFDIPTLVPLGGQIDLAVHPIDGSWWLISDASDALYRLTVAPDGSPTAGGLEVHIVTHPRIQQPRSISFGPQGTLHVSTGGQVLTLRADPDHGGWMIDPEFAAIDIPVGARFRIERSRTNFNPALHDTPEWTSVIPASELDSGGTVVPDCFGDLVPQPVADGQVDVFDLLALLDAWGPCPDPTNCPADIAPSPGGDGVVNVFDLLELLGRWGPCPSAER